MVVEEAHQELVILVVILEVVAAALYKLEILQEEQPQQVFNLVPLRKFSVAVLAVQGQHHVVLEMVEHLVGVVVREVEEGVHSILVVMAELLSKEALVAEAAEV
jgi:hypothetical protein